MKNDPIAQSRPLEAAQLQDIRFGEPQRHRNVTVIPLLWEEDGGPVYLALREALEGRLLTVTELSQAGSVPELRVVNQADLPVLLLDGEELAGAKQNRVLNTTILVRAKSETTIPVSCTEQGRWRYSSSEFADSGVVMTRKARAHKSRSVSDSLAASAQYHSDQHEVWAQIHHLHQQAGTSSPTAAMLDAFKMREAELAEALGRFPLVPGQHGLLVLVNGQVVGLDWVSRGRAYEHLHAKLVKSYVFDGLVEEAKAVGPGGNDTEAASAFLKEIGSLAGQPFPSVGQGIDYRFKSKNLVGSALVHENHLVHLGFFRLDDEGDSVAPMAGLRARRRWRSE
jgi:hypothetical protein